jgi:hypothetical protein
MRSIFFVDLPGDDEGCDLNCHDFSLDLNCRRFLA